MSSQDANAGELVSSGKYLDRKTLTWKIENFDEIRRSKDLIQSQRITIKLGEEAGFPTEWNCYLSPKIEENAQPVVHCIGVFFSLKKAPPKSSDAILSVQLGINKNNTRAEPGVKNFIVDGKIFASGWGWHSFLKAETKSETILFNGCLFLELDMKLFSSAAGPVAMDVVDVEKRYRLKFSEKLYQDMGKMLTEPLTNGNSETTIISKDGVGFSVNRGILSARSPVFDRMFQADMEESKTGMVQITDLSSETIRVLLHFLYTGNLQKEWKASTVLAELVYAASKYQLPDLLAFLDDIAGKVCCKENVGSLIGQARKLGLKQAENELVDFIRKNMTSLDDMISFAEDCTVSNFT